MRLERREVLKGVAAVAATEKLADGGLAPVSLASLPRGVRSPLPPGADDAASFAQACIGCGLCIASCRGECLTASSSLLSLGRPQMDYRRGYCLLGCTVCGDVCPTGAIRKLQAERRPYVRIGEAVWRKDLCVRTTTGDECTACLRKCPVRAIHLVSGFPVVDKAVCIGCGACQHVCPARPEPAIVVSGYERPRQVTPISEEDLVAEMRTLVAGGKTLVVARGGVIVRAIGGRGLAPLLATVREDPEALAGALVYDKVVGRAAAAFYVKGRARAVCAEVMSEKAFAMLRAAGIAVRAVRRVPEIAGRGGRGVCPLERAVDGLEDPAEMIDVLKKKAEALSSNR